MSNKYPLIAAAVAAAVTSGYAFAAAPSISTAAGATNTLVMAGSSAAAPAVASFIENTLCGGTANTLLVTSAAPSGGTGSKNFLAYSCNTAVQIVDPNGGPTINSGSLVTIYYRTEGGSVVGALPIAANHTVLRLNLANSSCSGAGLTATCTVSGLTATSGTQDSWTGAVTPDFVQLGVTDVEPAQLTGKDYPTSYSVSAFGTATTAQMQTLSQSAVPLFQQVFGLVVNTSGQSFSSVNLTKEAAANILLGKYTNWNKVPNATTGAPISSSSSAITHVDREPGSGTRTSTNIFFLGYQCGTQNFINSPTSETLNFSTGDELTLANNTAGSIAYASIDNILNPHSNTFPNLVLAQIDGVTPSTINAATGAYGYWFEATLVPSTTVSTSSPAFSLSDFLQANLPDLSSVPALPDINVIPFATGNDTPTVPLTSNGQTGTLAVYVNPFTRGGNSCSVPVENN
jgi:ABC-type phosphate transport system substrate-binding protein